MSRLSDQDIEAIARKIASDLRGSPAPRSDAPAPTPAPAAAPSPLGLSIFGSIPEAVAAAQKAFPVFVALPLAVRGKIIAAIRQCMMENATALAKAAWEETKLGRFEDKIVKNQLVTEKTPGIEDLYPTSYTGDHGLTLVEPAPYGVIGAITPTTNPTSTIICNTIGMLAAGNTVVFNVHPSAKNCSMQTVALLNKTIVAAGGPALFLFELLDAALQEVELRLQILDRLGAGGTGGQQGSRASGQQKDTEAVPGRRSGL